MSGTEIESSEPAPTAYASYKILILSNVFFVVASVCYLAASVLDYQENQKPQADQGVSWSWPLLMAGALSFVVVGVLDYWNTQQKIHVFLILAGMTGTISAATSKTNLPVSLIANLISVHLFLLESIQWIYGHVVRTSLDHNDSRRKSLRLAELGDLTFFIGALTDVILGYFYLVSNSETLVAAQSVATARAEVSSAIFWLVASLCTITVSCRTGKQGFAGAGGEIRALETTTSGSIV